MPFVNYVKEHICFMEYAADRGLSAAESALWQALFHIFNQRSPGGSFPDGFTPIKNDRLMTYFPMGYDAMARARNALVQRGLISYIRGRKNADAPMYQMNYLTVPREAAPETERWGGFAPVESDEVVEDGEIAEDDLQFYPQKTDKPSSWNVEKPVENSDSLTVYPQKTDKTANITIKQKETYINEEEEEEEISACARAPLTNSLDSELDAELVKLCVDQNDLENVVAKAVRWHYGRDATRRECSRLALIANNLGMTRELLWEAIATAALEGAKKLVGYTTTVLREMDEQEIRTAKEWEEYQALKMLAIGRADGIRHDVDKEMEAARERRKAAHAEADRGGGKG